MMRFHRAICASLLAIAVGCAQAQADDSPRVLAVQPSGPEVPANLLRLSIRFAAQVEGEVLPRLALARSDGTRLDAPFLQQELWSPNGEVLTILLHPGRVKTGLNARVENGPILSAGDDVALTFDGVPIKRWHVTAEDRIGPIASTWVISPVAVGSKQVLSVTLDGAIDGLDVDYLAIADARGRRIAGSARLIDGETRWCFSPDVSWRESVYELVVRGTLEDAAGNRLGGRFETSIDSPSRKPEDAAIAFTVGASRVIAPAELTAR